jgi:plastocyanin
MTAIGVGIHGAEAQDGAQVSIVDFAFQPASVEVPAGGTVTWTNTGAAPHTATADGGAFDSGQLAPGATFSQTFNAVGNFPYHCEIHPEMVGTVNVVEATAAQTAPAADTAAETPAPEAEVVVPAAEASPAAVDAAATGGQEGQGQGGRRARQLPATGTGIMALDEPNGSLALLAALAAAVLALVALRTYRRV